MAHCVLPRERQANPKALLGPDTAVSDNDHVIGNRVQCELRKGNVHTLV